MKVALGSKNPVKVRATKKVMRKIYRDVKIFPVKVDPGVGDNPMTEDETIEGAINRARRALEKVDADLGIGMEGGMVKKLDRYFLCGWCAVADKLDEITLSNAGYIEIPDVAVKKVLGGKELGDAMNEIVRMKDVKKKMGTIGVLTNNLMNRERSWEIALIFAMTKKLKPELYQRVRI
jgi:inosine/xanthosine triphosphatase